MEIINLCRVQVSHGFYGEDAGVCVVCKPREKDSWVNHFHNQYGLGCTISCEDILAVKIANEFYELGKKLKVSE